MATPDARVTLPEDEPAPNVVPELKMRAPLLPPAPVAFADRIVTPPELPVEAAPEATPTAPPV
jgi:hypothetical protein